MNRIEVLAAAMFVSLSTAASASDPPQWVVAIADSPTIQIPGLPPSSDYHTGEQSLADSGAGYLELVLVSLVGPAVFNFASLWTDRGGSLHAIAAVGDAGANGPGRVGNEANDVFRRFDWTLDFSSDGHAVFGATAGDPSLPIDSASDGIWIGDGTHNTEIARLDTEGALGPHLGDGWVFSQFDDGDPGEVIATALAGGDAIVRTSVSGPASSGNSAALHRYSASLGLQPCAVADSTDSALGSGVDDQPFSTIGYRVDASYGHIRAGATIGVDATLREGLWEFCAGAPIAQAVTDTPGVLGPGLLFADSVFTSISDSISAISPDVYLFTGSGTSMGAPFIGVFAHEGNANRPVLVQAGSTWSGIPGFNFDFDAGVQLYGRYGRTVMRANVVNGAGDDHRVGLWFVAPGHVPTLIALSGADSTRPPAIGHAWNVFGKIGVLANGDVIVQADTDLGYGIWRVRDGEPPTPVLAIDDLVQVPTASGVAITFVTSFLATFAEGMMQPEGGRDTWYGENGDVLAHVLLANFAGGDIWIRANVASDHILQDGFD